MILSEKIPILQDLLLKLRNEKEIFFTSLSADVKAHVSKNESELDSYFTDEFGSLFEKYNLGTIQKNIYGYNSIIPSTDTFITDFNSIMISHSNDMKIKELDERIKTLQIDNLLLQNRHIKRYVLYSIIGFFVGLLTSNLKFILESLKHAFQ